MRSILLIKSNGISNIIQAELFKKLQEKYPNRIIPFIFYYDEFEVNDSLDSQTGTHKIGAVYYSLPYLLPNIRSHLINIQVALLFNLPSVHWGISWNFLGKIS